MDTDKLIEDLLDQITSREKGQPEASQPKSNDLTCLVKVQNNTPSEWGIYLVGGTVFTYDDGSTYRHNILREHHAGDYLQFASNDREKCVVRTDTAVIAMSHQHPGQGKFAKVYVAPEGECMLLRGFAIGPKEDAKADSEFMQSWIGVSAL